MGVCKVKVTIVGRRPKVLAWVGKIVRVGRKCTDRTVGVDRCVLCVIAIIIALAIVLTIGVSCGLASANYIEKAIIDYRGVISSCIQEIRRWIGSP